DGASLLAVGVVSVEGRFEPGAAIEIVGPDGAAFAKGLATVAAAELDRRVRGVEAVHRDRLVLL
ncbi:MAG: glutamate 5-kinase, partial [Actinobacteria bacterium]|nr:glutamate 5-kinase [Actinomycetota bacterium]